MGQANRRGTFEQRYQEALCKKQKELALEEAEFERIRKEEYNLVVSEPSDEAKASVIAHKRINLIMTLFLMTSLSGIDTRTK